MHNRCSHASHHDDHGSHASHHGNSCYHHDTVATTMTQLHGQGDREAARWAWLFSWQDFPDSL